MSTKVAVVTGSNSGIGLSIGQEAVAILNKEGLYPKYHQLDITDSKSVTKFRDHIKENHGRIDILINNAGIAFRPDATEPASVQAEKTVGVNYFGTLLTCEILLPILRDGGRVVNVASDRGHLSYIPSKMLRERLKMVVNLTVTDLNNLAKEFLTATKNESHVAEWGNSTYIVSKVFVVALTKIHQKEVSARDIKVNAVHPGHVKTELTLFKGTLTPEQGAQSSLYAALDAPDSVRGSFIWCDKSIVEWDGELPSNEKLF